MTFVHTFAIEGDLQGVKQSLQNGVNVDIRDNYGGSTPLLYASSNGRLGVVKYLVENKANVNARDSDGATPLHLASWCGQAEVVQYLVEHAGANVEDKDRFGRTPLLYAIRNNRPQVVHYLVHKAGAVVCNKLKHRLRRESDRRKQVFVWQELLRRRQQLEQDRQTKMCIQEQQQHRRARIIPQDVFLIHTGADGQKADLVSTMKHFMEERKLSCFLDDNMKKSLHPNQTMEANLQMCRHAVAVVSKAFLQRPSPCAELQYAYTRMQWLNNQGDMGWHSLWVVLYDVSVDEYKQAWKAAGTKIPPIHHELQMFRYNQGHGEYRNWVSLCDAVIKEIKDADEEQDAQAKWTHLLNSGSPAIFPIPRNIYDHPQEGCCPREIPQGSIPIKEYTQGCLGIGGGKQCVPLIHKRRCLV